LKTRTVRLSGNEKMPDWAPPSPIIGSDGYVVLRWYRDYETIEVLEHRLVMKAAPGQTVHHLNHTKTDNRRENLIFIDSSSHSRHHMKRLDDRRAAELYGQGYSTVDVGTILGFNAATVYRALKQAGVPIRSIAAAQTLPHAIAKRRKNREANA
jgi:hypothetical protein